MPKLLSVVFFGLCLSLLACEKEQLVAPRLTMEVPFGGYLIQLEDTFRLQAQAENAAQAQYNWLIEGEEFSTEQTLEFVPAAVGEYAVMLQVATEGGKDQWSFNLSVVSESKTSGPAFLSPYISKVFDYHYGPGQHAQTLAKKADGSAFIGDTQAYVLLGGWGGYITAGFDHTISNEIGNDFGVFTQPSIGSEPAVVFVMQDSNDDGLPNDGQWLQLKGSEFENPETVRNYEVTYFLTDSSEHVYWKDNQGQNGELLPEYESESWWWLNGQREVTLTGVKLPDSHHKDGDWTNIPGLFQWGYAENYQGEDHDEELRANLFDIQNAVDAQGNAVSLSGIDFIKVQSAVFQQAGWLNEVSTEIRGAFDLQMIQ